MKYTENFVVVLTLRLWSSSPRLSSWIEEKKIKIKNRTEKRVYLPILEHWGPYCATECRYCRQEKLGWRSKKDKE